MKIARIFTGDLNNRKGKFNNVIERVKHLQSAEGVQSDLFLISYAYTWSFRLFKNVQIAKSEEQTIDGIAFRTITVKMTLLEYLLVYRLKIKDIACKDQLSRYVDLFKDYDILATHDILSSYLASLVKQRFNLPYVITWHGSDINKYPHRSKPTYNTIKYLLEDADYNFFVSKTLMESTDSITKRAAKSHLYSGPADSFFRKSDEEIDRFKKELQIHTKHVVGFIGNLEPIKNVLALPEIFHRIQRKVVETTFVIIGDGRQENQLKERMESQGVSNVIFTGKVEAPKVPDYLNTFDLLVLPSLSEGMPRVILEALACGVHVVGSDVGGIPEAIGEENSFSLNQDFEVNVSERVIELLKQGITPRNLSDEFSWDKTIEKEVEVLNAVKCNTIQKIPK